MNYDKYPLNTKNPLLSIGFEFPPSKPGGNVQVNVLHLDGRITVLCSFRMEDVKEFEQLVNAVHIINALMGKDYNENIMDLAVGEVNDFYVRLTTLLIWKMRMGLLLM